MAVKNPLALYAGDIKELQSGDTINGAGISSGCNVQLFTSNGTWTKPAGAKWVNIYLVSAGGGGGSGARGAASTFRGGGGGGAGGKCLYATQSADAFGATVSVTVGAGGNGGAARTTNSIGGNSGSTGGTSTFGVYTLGGGNAGGGGTTAAANNNGYSATLPNGSEVYFPPLFYYKTYLATSGAETGANVGIAAGGAYNGTAQQSYEGKNGWLSAGGGFGAYRTAANTAIGATSGGVSGDLIRPPQTTAPETFTTKMFQATAATQGQNGTSAFYTNGMIISTSGGGGGAVGDAAGTIAGGAGGDGGRASGGGGGGSSTNGANSGAGGKGGDGFVLIITWV